VIIATHWLAFGSVVLSMCSVIASGIKAP
jgi:hypothetical protein